MGKGIVGVGSARDGDPIGGAGSTDFATISRGTTGYAKRHGGGID